MSKRKRVSLSVRLQPYEGTLLAEVASWLNSLEREEASRLISEAIVMAYLPYARSSGGAVPEEISRCCWETQDLLDKHGFNLRQALQVSQPQWSKNYISPSTSSVDVVSTPQDESEIDSIAAHSNPQDQFQHQSNVKELDAIFGDD